MNRYVVPAVGDRMIAEGGTGWGDAEGDGPAVGVGATGCGSTNRVTLSLAVLPLLGSVAVTTTLSTPWPRFAARTLPFPSGMLFAVQATSADGSVFPSNVVADDTTYTGVRCKAPMN